MWKAFVLVVLPHSTGEVKWDSMWLKLKVGDWLKAWVSHQRNYPICNEVKTVTHTLHGCKFQRLGFVTITCYGDPPHQGTSGLIGHNLLHDALAPTTMQGILLWFARHANWKKYGEWCTILLGRSWHSFSSGLGVLCCPMGLLLRVSVSRGPICLEFYRC